MTVLAGVLRKLPMMPIREMVIFPHMMTPFVVGRKPSVRALEEALAGDRKIFLATQRRASVDEPGAEDIFETGTIGNIVQNVRMPDGNFKVLLEGIERARSIEVNLDDGFFVATVQTGSTQLEMTPEVEQTIQRVHTLFEQLVKRQSDNLPPIDEITAAASALTRYVEAIAGGMGWGIDRRQELLDVLKLHLHPLPNRETTAANTTVSVRMDEPNKLADTIAAQLQLGIAEKQQLLDVFDPETRLARVADVLEKLG